MNLKVVEPKKEEIRIPPKLKQWIERIQKNQKEKDSPLRGSNQDTRIFHFGPEMH